MFNFCYKINPKLEEKKNMEKLPSIFIAFRDNDLFKEQIPEIVKKLQLMGRNVNIQNFPKGTEKEEIKKWYEGNKDKLQGMEIISDYTFQQYAGLKVQPELVLDWIMDDAAEIAVIGSSHDKMFEASAEKALDIERQIFIRIIKRIQEKTNGRIKKIFLVKQINNHHSRYFLKTTMELQDKSGKDQNKSLKEKEQEYAELLKQWSEIAGIQKIQIVNSPNEVPETASEEEGTYVIYDRHIDQNIGLIFYDKKLPLPVADLLYEAKKKFGDLTKHGEVKSIISEILEKKFGKK